MRNLKTNNIDNIYNQVCLKKYGCPLPYFRDIDTSQQIKQNIRKAKRNFWILVLIFLGVFGIMIYKYLDIIVDGFFEAVIYIIEN